MKSKRVLLSLGVTSGLVILALTLVWGTLVGAAPYVQVVADLDVAPTAVSPDDVNVSIGDRTITITVDDADLNVAAFVGTGPNGETATFDQVGDASTGDGERVMVGTDALGSFIASLVANNLPEAGGFTPMADRDGDGDIDINDIEIVLVTGGGLVQGDVLVASIFNAGRGQVTFQVFKTGLQAAGAFFDVRYATHSSQLARDTKIFTETLDIPSTSLLVGESFTHSLAISLQDTNGDGTVSTADVTASAGLDVTAVADSASATLKATAPKAVDDAVTLDYLGNEVLTVAADVVAGGTFTVDLTNTVTSAVTVVAVAGGAIADVTVGNLSGKTQTFTAVVARTAGDTFTVQYAGTEALTVPNAGLFDSGATPTDGEAFTLDLNMDWLPLQDTNGDGTVSTADITISITGVSAANTPQVTDIGATSVLSNPATGAAGGTEITLAHSGDALAADKELKVSYNGLADLLTVRGSNNNDIPLRIRETEPDSGVFQGKIIAIDGSASQADQLNTNLDPTKTGDADSPLIAVIAGDQIIVKYDDRSPNVTAEKRIDVEDEPPTFPIIEPADDAITNDLTTSLTTEVEDTIAGVDASKFDIDLSPPSGSVKLETLTFDGVPQDVVSGDIAVAETFAGSGVWMISYSISKIAAIKDAIDNDKDIDNKDITWEFTVKDNAGNNGTTGVRTLTVIKLKPGLLNAYSGDHWNSSDELLEGSRPGLPGSDVRTSIRVEFNNPMGGGSFQTTDFLVDGQVPEAVAHFTDMAASVFLTVPELGPTATPTVEVVDEVKDTGGNALSSGSVVAKDGIAPDLTVTIVDNYTDGNVSLGVVSDEPIAASLPKRTFNHCFASDTECDRVVTPTTSSKIVVSQREWTFDVKGVGVGRYVVVVEAKDAAGNEAKAGGTDSTASPDETFEIDTALPDETEVIIGIDTIAEGETTEVSEADPFVIELDWSSEGTEYTGDSHKGVTLTKAVLDAGTDDEKDVLAGHSTKDNRKFSIAILGGVGVGEHTLTFSGSDELGKENADRSRTFEVVAPAPFELDLTPGLNLVSIPGDPADGDIDSIFGDLAQVNLIVAREGDQWLVALRDPDTLSFDGPQSTLSTIDASHAYWIRATATVTASIGIPPLGFQAPLPELAVRAGWNLVPVISLLPAAETTQGTELDADVYLGGNWRTAFTFDRGRWHKIVPKVDPQCGTAADATDLDACGGDHTVATPDSLDDAVQIGRGYWVRFNAADSIVP